LTGIVVTPDASALTSSGAYKPVDAWRAEPGPESVFLLGLEQRR